MTLIIYFLLAYGICNMIIFANGPFHIFLKMHEYFKEKHPMLEEMTSCYIPFTPMNFIIADKVLWPIIVDFDGLITSGGCWLLHTCQEAVERSNN